MRKFIDFILLLIILLLSCNDLLKQKELKELSLSCTLSPDHEYQNIYLYKTSQEITEEHQHINFVIRDAKVYINYDNNTIPLKYYENSKNMQYSNLYGPAYSDRYNPIEIKKGDKYNIIVKYPDTCLRGYTVIPKELKIITPKNGDTLPADRDININLNINNIDRRITVDLFSRKMKGIDPLSLKGDSIIHRWRLHHLDTLANSPLVINKNMTRDSFYIWRYDFRYIKNSAYKLKVKLWDKNITEYHFGNDNSSGIKYGGYGYVGSCISDSVKFYIREDTLLYFR